MKKVTQTSGTFLIQKGDAFNETLDKLRKTSSLAYKVILTNQLKYINYFLYLRLARKNKLY